MSASPDRLRVPPRERFAGSERIFDLATAFAELPAESVSRQGHMQKTLYRLGPTTTAIFSFEAGGALHQYTVDGEAIVHVIKGRLRLSTSSHDHELTSDQMLLLDPGVPHELIALQPSHVLLTVVLNEGD